uniref:ATP-binding protein n=1 Tax=Staphylococcus capitis TaxID=29388 RepID=UPI0037093A8E
FDNVITNPMKYSRPDKRVDFHVKQNPLYNTITIPIKHNPIPIPINKLHKIFHTFYPVDKPPTRNIARTPLRLPISKQI